MTNLKKMSVWVLMASLFLTPAFVLADRGRGGGDGDRGRSGQSQSVQIAQDNSGPGSSNSGPGNVNRDRDDDDNDDDIRILSSNSGSGNMNRDDDDDDDRVRGSNNSGSRIIQNISSGRGGDQERIRVRENGRVEIRGAMITSVSGSTFQISVVGRSFSVNAGSARLQDRDDVPISLASFAVGHQVRVEGVFSPTTQTTVINASRVINRSIEVNECLVDDDDDGIFGDDDDCVIVNPDVTAPVLSGITAVPGANSATITWTTNEPSTSRVFFGTQNPLIISGAVSESNAALVTSHTIVLTGLTPSTTYNYIVRSVDAASNAATSAQFSFTTQPAPTADTTAPVVSGVTAAIVAPNTATVTWLTNELATSKLFFGTTTPLVLTAPTTMSVSNPALVTSHSISVSGLTASTTYQFIIQSADASGNTFTTDQLQLVNP